MQTIIVNTTMPVAPVAPVAPFAAFPTLNPFTLPMMQDKPGEVSMERRRRRRR